MSKKGWTFTAVGGFLVGLVVFLVNAFDLRDRVFPRPTEPRVVLTRLEEPGPTIEYDPKSKTLSFKVTFAADNSGTENETIVAIGGSLDSRDATTLIHFISPDFACLSNGKNLLVFPIGVPQEVHCDLSHHFTASTADKLKAPGTLVLHIALQGRRERVYPLQYCIAATDGFWRDFLGSRVKAERYILNPSDCE